MYSIGVYSFYLFILWIQILFDGKSQIFTFVLDFIKLCWNEICYFLFSCKKIEILHFKIILIFLIFYLK